MNKIKCLTLVLLSVLLLSSCAHKEKPDSVDVVNEQTDLADNENKEEQDSSKNDDTNQDTSDSKNGENNPSDPDGSTFPSDSDNTQNPTDNQPNVPVQDPLKDAQITSVAPKNDYSTLTLETFFDDAAFVGDSVMYGFDLYTSRNQTVEASSTFLTITSFAARHALSDVGPNSYHPSYNGVKMKVEDALALDGAKAAFIFLGLNDVRVTPNSYYDNYIEFMGRIREKNPNIDLFILSTTYPVESPGSMDKATAASYRDQLQDLNVRLKAWCDEGNAYFINVVSPLLNEHGFLDSCYSSDNYVHLTNSAYAVWASTIENYIDTMIQSGTAPQSTFVEFTDATANSEPEAPASEPSGVTEENTTPENAENIENTASEEV